MHPKKLSNTISETCAKWSRFGTVSETRGLAIILSNTLLHSMQGEHILSGNNGIMRRYVLSTKNCLWIKCAAHDDDGDDDDVLLCNFI